MKPVHLLRVAIPGILLLSSACRVTEPEQLADACTPAGEPLRAAFYAYYPPVSYSADEDPASPGFHTHLGYEADLLTAMEAMEGARLSFERSPVAEWPDIWLLPSTPDVDIVGGGISIPEPGTTPERWPWPSRPATSPFASRCWCVQATRDVSRPTTG